MLGSNLTIADLQRRYRLDYHHALQLRNDLADAESKRAAEQQQTIEQLTKQATLKQVRGSSLEQERSDLLSAVFTFVGNHKTQKSMDVACDRVRKAIDSTIERARLEEAGVYEDRISELESTVAQQQQEIAHLKEQK